MKGQDAKHEGQTADQMSWPGVFFRAAGGAHANAGAWGASLWMQLQELPSACLHVQTVAWQLGITLQGQLDTSWSCCSLSERQISAYSLKRVAEQASTCNLPHAKAILGCHFTAQLPLSMYGQAGVHEQRSGSIQQLAGTSMPWPWPSMLHQIVTRLENSLRCNCKNIRRAACKGIPEALRLRICTVQ